MNREKILCIRKCSNCGLDVKIKHNHRINLQDVFCSQNCSNEYRKKNREKNENYFNCICPMCNKKFHLKPYSLNKYSNHYCSKECHRLAKTQYMKGEKNHQYGIKGSKNSSWKSDKKITNYGYIKIRSLEHPFKDCDGFVFEHRLIAEQYLLNEENSIIINVKKYLKPEYEVHHIDGNKLNNKLENLKVITKKEHVRLHSQERIKKISKQVDQYDLNGKYLKTYFSIKDAAIENNLHSQNIIRVCKNKSKTAGGYIWKYTKK